MRSRFTGAHCGRGRSQGFIRFAVMDSATGRLPPRSVRRRVAVGRRRRAAARSRVRRARAAAGLAHRAGAGSLAPTPVGRRRLDRRELERRGLSDVTLVGSDTGGMLAAAGRRAPPGADLAARADAVRRAGGLPAGAVQADVRAGALPTADVCVPAAPAVRARAAAADRVRVADQAGDRASCSRAGARRPCATARSCATPRTSPRHVDPGVLLDAAPKLRSFEGEVVIAWPPEDPCFPLSLGGGSRRCSATHVRRGRGLLLVRAGRPPGRPRRR